MSRYLHDNSFGLFCPNSICRLFLHVSHSRGTVFLSLGLWVEQTLPCEPSKDSGREYRVDVGTRDNLKAAFPLIVQVAFGYPISLRVSQDYFFSRVVKNTRRFLFQVMCLISWGRRSFLNNLESGTIKDGLPLYRPQPYKRKKKKPFSNCHSFCNKRSPNHNAEGKTVILKGI